MFVMSANEEFVNDDMDEDMDDDPDPDHLSGMEDPENGPDLEEAITGSFASNACRDI